MIEAILCMAFLLTPATLHDGKCTACEKFHVKSTVTMSLYGSSTLMVCLPKYTYDEDGKPAPIEPCNTITVEGRCSRGHHIVVQTKTF